MRKIFRRSLALFLVLALLVVTNAFQTTTTAVAATNVVSDQVQMDTVYMFRNAQTGQLMTALADGTVVQRAFNGSNNQQWMVTDQLSSFWSSLWTGNAIVPLSSPEELLRLSPTAGMFYSDDMPLSVRRLNNTPSEFMWQFAYLNNGAFRIRAARTDRFIGISGNTVSIRSDGNAAMVRWEIIRPGTVTFNATYNGGTNAQRTAQFFEGAQVNLGLVANRDGWGFAGWHTNPNATTGLTSFSMPATDVTLYAIFRQEGSVSFVNWGSESNVTWSAATNETNTMVLAPAQIVPNDFSPRGWTTSIEPVAEPIVSPAGGLVPVAPVYYGL